MRSFHFSCTRVSSSNDDIHDAKDIPGVKSSGDKLVMFYTCKKCDTRSVKKISKQGYEKGVVVVRCPSCDSMHLIADRLGIFEDGNWDIQKYLQSQGENVKVVNSEKDVLELTNIDFIGSTSTNSSNNSNINDNKNLDKPKDE